MGTNETGLLGYTAAKTGVVGLMRSWANFLAPHSIRVNCIAPTAVRTPMAQNLSIADLFKVNPALASAMPNAMPVEMVEAIDISNAIAWLVSDDAATSREPHPVDAGQLIADKPRTRNDT